jgi:hypothetical protein
MNLPITHFHPFSTGSIPQIILDLMENDDQVGYSFRKSVEWCSGMKYMTSDAGNDGEASIPEF